VYTKEELEQVYQICRTNGVIIAEDEIHSDFIYKGYKHIPLQSLHTEGVITMTAPSKTFNLAALKTAMVICQDDALWEKFSKDAKCTGLDNVSLFGHIATVAAYSNGAAYVDAMVEYLEENLNLVCKELQTMPQISMVRPQGTYLLWLDCTSLGLHNKELMDFFANEAGVTFSEGTSFGPEGDGWLRMNIACPRSILTEALARMRKALENK
jgi:cystathionine beta-lyase